MTRPGNTLIVPMYNEAENLKVLAPRLNEIMEHGVELVIVDNGSIDDTAGVASALLPGARIVRAARPNKGLGAGVKAGLAVVDTSTVGWLPGNGKVDPMDVLNLFAISATSGVVVKALRDGRPFDARIKTALAGLAQTVVLGQWVRDTGGTPTVIPAQLIASMLEGPDDYGFETFTLVVAKRERVQVRRVRVRFGNRSHGASHWQRGIGSELGLLKNLLIHARRWRNNQH